MIKILGTGLTGLVGSRIVELLGNQYQFENISYETGIDITDKKSVLNEIKKSNASIVLHLAAKTDVDGCELDRERDIKTPRYQANKQTAYAINVLGTRNITEACEKSGKRLIYISTDFVFDGKKGEPYTEEDIPNPLNWYAKTKYEGEKIVQNSAIPWLIVRIAYPYRAFFQKKDFVRGLIEKFKKGERLLMIEDHVMTPTFIDDIANAIDVLIKNNPRGIFHAVGSTFVTPFEAAKVVAEEFGFDLDLVGKIKREEYFKNRAERPFDLRLRNDKIQKLGIRMRSFEEGIREIKKQCNNLLL